MHRPTAPTVTGLDALLRGTFLGPATRRDLADLNRWYLDLSLAPGATADVRFAWSEDVQRGLLALDEAMRGRMAECPFSFFRLVLPTGHSPDTVPGRVEDALQPEAAAISSRCVSFLHLALFTAWRLADGAPLAARLALGLSPAEELALNEASAAQLAPLAAWPGLIRPRWPAHATFWATLAGAARRDSRAALQWAHCMGLCLLEAENAGRDGMEPGVAPRRRPRR